MLGKNIKSQVWNKILIHSNTMIWDSFQDQTLENIHIKIGVFNKYWSVNEEWAPVLFKIKCQIKEYKYVR